MHGSKWPINSARIVYKIPKEKKRWQPPAGRRERGTAVIQDAQPDLVTEPVSEEDRGQSPPMIEDRVAIDAGPTVEEELRVRVQLIGHARNNM